VASTSSSTSTDLREYPISRFYTSGGGMLIGYRLLDLGSEELRDLVHARARRRFNRGLKRKPMGLIKKLRIAKQNAKPNEKPDQVKTHLRDMIVVPEMIGSVIGVYSGKDFNQVEIKPEMVGHYLAEFSIS
jgi:small subunit ribosomal protein S15e